VRRLLALLTGAMFAFTVAAPVSAHAELVLASPEPGTGLAQAPAAVIVKFSEPLNLSLCRIEVLDARGADVGQGATQAVAGDAQAMRRSLGLLPTGQYTVRWTSVSSLDGHTLRGTYFFAVGTAAQAGSSIADSPLDSEGPLGLIGRFVALIALGLWLAAGILRRPSARAELDASRVRTIAHAAPALAFAGTALSLASSAFVATGSLLVIGAVLASPSGQARLAVLAASALGALVGPGWRVLGVVLASVAIVADAASGHAASAPLPLLAIGSFSIHLAAVGIWTYAIASSLLAAPDLRRALATFTPYAVVAAGLVALTGLVNAVLEVADPADLLETGYGLALLAKSLAFVLMASFGFVHFLWRRRPATSEATLRGPVRAEASAATTALVLATLLVGSPNPPREAQAATESLTTTDPVLAELGDRDALSIGDASGPFVVGLTILPPKPGPAQLRLQVIGVEAGDALRDPRVEATSGASSTTIPLNEACGLGCFTGKAQFDRAGDWRLRVHVETNRGPITIEDSVPLPAPDGSEALARTLRAEEALKSAVLTERLRGSVEGPVYVSTYRFQAPDRAEIRLKDSTQIIIGEKEFIRTGTGPWKETSFPSPGFSWPSSYYREFWRGAAAARVLGPARVDGVACTVLAFVRPDVAAWFRIWVGVSDGLVRRQEMRAEGHLMDHDYSQLNGAISVTPPQ
jgi:copper transport protein